ncbi:hypothetical protein D3C87_125960 [compost metagenome]
MFNFSILFFGLLNFAHAAGDGSLIGNGGNTVFCTPSKQAVFKGFYTLDYLLDYRTSGPYSETVEVKSWEESFARIEKGLLHLSPVLAKSFHDFSENILTGKVSSGRLWIPWDLTDVLIDDQEITQRLPDNCYRAPQQPDLHQTVVRSYGRQSVEYRFQKNILENLRFESPLQFSFFIVHEWLWDFTQDVRSLRRLNWILHSKEFDSLSEQEWQDFFERTQFFNRQLPVCHRSAMMKDQILKAIGKTCDKIDSEDLAQVKSLDLSSLPTGYAFRSGDFSGLYALRTLDLRNSPGVLEQLTPFAFKDLLNLEVILAKGSGFEKLPEHLREGARGARVRVD